MWAGGVGEERAQGVEGVGVGGWADSVFLIDCVGGGRECKRAGLTGCIYGACGIDLHILCIRHDFFAYVYPYIYINTHIYMTQRGGAKMGKMSRGKRSSDETKITRSS